MSERVYGSAIYDPTRDRLVVYGGDDGIKGLNDVWALGWGVPVSVPGDDGAVTDRFELAPPRPNPSRDETFFAFELAEPSRVILDVFDAQGRQVRRIADAWFTAGRHVTTWSGGDEGGQRLGTGVYFVRLQGRGFSATRRVVRVR